MTLPVRIRINAQFPFPTLVTSSGPVTITKQNGIWSVGLSFANIAAVPGGTPASQIGILVYNTGSQTYQQIAASALPTSYIFTTSSAPASAGGQTVVLGTLGGPPGLTNTGQAVLCNSTTAGAILQGDGSSYDVSISNKSGGLALTVTTGTQNAQFYGSLLGSGATTQLGFAVGAGSGSAVTQATSRTTGVTINTSTGTISMFSAAGSATAATFTVTNSSVAATDVIHLSQKSGTNLYNFLVTAVAAGSFNITFFTTGGVATDAPVINFVVLKGSAT
jgi:hypothetical protein